MTLIEFIQANWYLVAMLAAVIVAIIVYEIKRAGNSAKTVSNLELSRLVNDGAILIDVRSAKAYQEGHISQAKSVPPEKFAAYAQNSKVKKDRLFVLYCQNGLGAKAQAQLLRDQDFSEVYVLKNGISGWIEDNLPTV